MKVLISVALVILLTCLASAGSVKPKKIEILGVVVARDVITPLANTSYHNMSSELFIVRVAEPKKLATQSRYVKIYYSRWMNDPYLPSDFFESGKRWRFKVLRNPECDGTMKKMARIYNIETDQPTYREELLPKRTPGYESEPIPLDEILPCYVLKPGDLKSIDN